MSLKYVGLAVALVLVLALGMTYPKSGGTVVERVVDRVTESVGGAAGADRYFDTFNENGVGMAYAQVAMVSATSTPCAIKAPTSATSTLMGATIEFRTASTSAATNVTIAKSAGNPTATTTIIGNQFSIAAAKKATISASTSPASNPGSVIFAPGEVLVIGVDGTAPLQMNAVGSCNAIFRTSI